MTASRVLTRGWILDSWSGSRQLGTEQNSREKNSCGSTKRDELGKTSIEERESVSQNSSSVRDSAVVVNEILEKSI